ncbi:MAG: GGDEF domain-containing protein [Anaerolineales bacterium]|jgi:diguanylate cyclase (GGDEF)-like protein
MTDTQNNEIQRLTAELEKANKDLCEAQRLIERKTVELKAVLAQAEEVSHVDELTCLPNRRQVIKTLQNEVIRAERYKTPLSISMIDIDHFKKINDSYGHTVGDQVLFQLANILQDGIRDPDTVGRYGGEEFLVVLPNTRMNEATEQAARLCKRIREAEINIGEVVHLTVSIGVAEHHYGQENWQKFLSRADLALYDAKNSGRDRWAVSQ